jgi:hypothetical protein
VREVAGSNPVVPTISDFDLHLATIFKCSLNRSGDLDAAAADASSQERETNLTEDELARARRRLTEFGVFARLTAGKQW